MTEGAVKPKPRISFEEGENVRVIDGPFANFSGIVEEVKPEKQKVRVLRLASSAARRRSSWTSPRSRKRKLHVSESDAGRSISCIANGQ